MRLRYLSGSLRIPPSTTKQILFFAKSCSVCITTLEKCKPIWNETLLSWPISRSIFQQYQHSSHSRFKCSAYYGEMWIGKMNYIGSLASARDRWLRLITDNLAVKYFSALFHLKKGKIAPIICGIFVRHVQEQASARQSEQLNAEHARFVKI